jgi:hypothetical protein
LQLPAVLSLLEQRLQLGPLLCHCRNLWLQALLQDRHL